MFKQRLNIPARPPVAADTPKWPYFGRITFSARRHTSKSCSLFVIPLRNKTCRPIQNLSKISIKHAKKNWYKYTAHTFSHMIDLCYITLETKLVHGRPLLAVEHRTTIKSNQSVKPVLINQHFTFGPLLHVPLYFRRCHLPKLSCSFI